MGLDRTFWKIYLNPSYNLQANFPFAYLGALDASLKSVVVSYVSLIAHYDRRNDSVHPTSGSYLSNEVQHAGLGGDARDVREQPEARVYVPVTTHATFAARATIGFLLPFNYGSAMDQAESGVPPDDPRDAWTRDIQITYFRGFFSGGPNSNRGNPLRDVGPHGMVPLFTPTIAATQLANACKPGSATYDPVRCAISLGIAEAI
jgi:outer membrane protein insertion porin family/translocation and assembly module TamA